MANKKTFWGMLVLAMMFWLALNGCATINNSLVAGEGETLVVIQRKSMFTGLAVNVTIFVDGKKVMVLGNGQTGKFTVKNGKHTIYAKTFVAEGWKRFFTADSEELRYTAEVEYLEAANDAAKAPPESLAGTTWYLSESWKNSFTQFRFTDGRRFIHEVSNYATGITITAKLEGSYSYSDGKINLSYDNNAKVTVEGTVNYRDLQIGELELQRTQ